MIVLTGSCTQRNSRVPTVVDGSKGVKRKWFLGGTTVIMITIIKMWIKPGRHHGDVELVLVKVPSHTKASPARSKYNHTGL